MLDASEGREPAARARLLRRSALLGALVAALMALRLQRVGRDRPNWAPARP